VLLAAGFLRAAPAGLVGGFPPAGLVGGFPPAAGGVVIDGSAGAAKTGGCTLPCLASRIGCLS